MPAGEQGEKAIDPQYRDDERYRIVFNSVRRFNYKEHMMPFYLEETHPLKFLR